MTGPAAAPQAANKRVVGISQMLVSRDIGDLLITYSLGSCIGVSVHDPQQQIGGLIHCMLPLSKIDRDKAAQFPSMFVDTGIPALLEAVFELGADKKRLIVKLAGAASALDSADRFRIGERNCTVLRKLLWKNDLLVAAEDVGGTKPRTMTLCIGSGETSLRTAAGVREL